MWRRAGRSTRANGTALVVEPRAELGRAALRVTVTGGVHAEAAVQAGERNGSPSTPRRCPGARRRCRSA
ncbi:MAG: hypothetical protein M5U09_25315 [Gammaproteobacteria bacterium]|nr:hypothetical protein [Gammaproteobacteria bacterium]